MNFEFITYSTPNYGAWELIEDQDVKNSPVAFPPNEIIERCTAFKYLGEDMERNYMHKWNEAKGK
jgi:spermidine/putrescine-binding protein